MDNNSFNKERILEKGVFHLNITELCSKSYNLISYERHEKNYRFINTDSLEDILLSKGFRTVYRFIINIVVFYLEGNKDNFIFYIKSSQK